MTIWEDEGRERLEIDMKSLEKVMINLRNIHKNDLDELMINYITDNKLELNETEAIRLFVKYLKEQ